MERQLFLSAMHRIFLTALFFCPLMATAQLLAKNIYGRKRTSLNGAWQVIIDPNLEMAGMVLRQPNISLDHALQQLSAPFGKKHRSHPAGLACDYLEKAIKYYEQGKKKATPVQEDYLNAAQKGLRIFCAGHQGH